MDYVEKLHNLECDIINYIKIFATQKGFRIGNNSNDYFIKVDHLFNDEDNKLMYIGNNGVFLDEYYLKLETMPPIHDLAYVANNLNKCIFEYRISFEIGIHKTDVYYQNLSDVEKDLNGGEFDVVDNICFSKLVISDDNSNIWAELDFKCIIVELGDIIHVVRNGWNELIDKFNSLYSTDFNDYDDILKFIIQHDNFKRIDLVSDFTAFD